MTAAVVLDWLLVAVMSPFLPIAPFLAAVIANDSSYVRRYWQTLRKAVRHLWGLVRSQAFSRYLLHWRDSESHQPESICGQCTHCGNCCLHQSCIFLDWRTPTESSCRIYNRRFWKLLACGRYPENRLQIAMYDCPGFKAVPAASSLPATEPDFSAAARESRA